MLIIFLHLQTAHTEINYFVPITLSQKSVSVICNIFNGCFFAKKEALADFLFLCVCKLFFISGVVYDLSEDYRPADRLMRQFEFDSALLLFLYLDETQVVMLPAAFVAFTAYTA